MAMRTKGLGSVLAVAGMLAGCAPPQVPKLDVEKQWGDAVSNLGLFPIYPPSEDVMVGDAFLYVRDAKFFDLVRLTAAPLAPLTTQFCYQEKDRMALDTMTAPPQESKPESKPDAKADAKPDAKPDAKADAAKDAKPAPKPAAKPAAAGATPPAVTPGVVRQADDKRCHDQPPRQQIAPYDGKVTGVHVTRLREAAIPTLEVGRFTEGELVGAGLLGNFGAALGIGSSGTAALSVTLGKLQGATLDELRGFRLVEEITVERLRRARPGGRPDDPNGLTPLMLLRSLRLSDHRNDSRLAEMFCRGQFRELDDSGARVVVANRVMYAGHVTFEYLNQQVTAARLALDFAGAIAGLPSPTATPALPAAPAAPPAPTPPAAGVNPLDVQRAAILATANRIMSMTADGPAKVSARLTTGSFGRLALTQDFLRPAAVGMGAALQFPLSEAAVPASAAQVGEALAYCAEGFGLDAKALAPVTNRLTRNYGWALFLERRLEERGAIGAGRRAADLGAAVSDARAEVGRAIPPEVAAMVAVDATVPPGGRLSALPANARLRVRP